MAKEIEKYLPVDYSDSFSIEVKKKSLEKTNKKGTNVFVMPVNKAFAKTNEDRRKIEVT